MFQNSSISNPQHSSYVIKNKSTFQCSGPYMALSVKISTTASSVNQLIQVHVMEQKREMVLKCCSASEGGWVALGQQQWLYTWCWRWWSPGASCFSDRGVVWKHRAHQFSHSCFAALLACGWISDFWNPYMTLRPDYFTDHLCLLLPYCC